MDNLALARAGDDDLESLMRDLGAQARRAARAVGLSPRSQRDAALTAAAAALRAQTDALIDANGADMAEAQSKGAPSASLDRLRLDARRIESVAKSLEDIAALPDPLARTLDVFTRPNGLRIERVATPLGVIGVIFESRPNVAADAGALCLKAGNSCILRGGSDSFRSVRIIHECLVAGLKAAGLPEAAIALVPTRDRAAVGMMLAGLDGAVDVIVPRGGKSLVARVQQDARVPVFSHLEGVVHVYIDRDADLEKAKAIVLNAKLRRTGVCGAAETLLVDRAAAATHLAPLVSMLINAGAEVRGDAATLAADARARPAIEADWSTEYLDAVISVKLVDGVRGAIDHIERYGSHHTDAIVTENAETAALFLREVDSAIVVHNASTQFADGGEFGFGGEIGIATGRMHARGPVGLEQLTSFKYRVIGDGQIRPV